MSYPKQEYKYLLPLEHLDDVRREFRALLDLDPYAKRTGHGGYTVRSIYFDNAEFAAYREKIGGERLRRKFRIRAYNAQRPGDLAYLEIKLKQAGLLTKYRAAFRAEDVEALFNEQDLERYILPLQREAINKRNAERFFYHRNSARLLPVVLVVYDREAFVGKFSGDLRVTLDCNLRSVFDPGITGLYDDARCVSTMQHNCILEVKFTTGVPLAVRQVLQRHDLKRMALSKYTMCLDSHRAFASRSEPGRGRSSQLFREHPSAGKVLITI